MNTDQTTDHEPKTGGDIQEAERLLRAVCPDLQGTNLYLVDVKSLTGNVSESICYAVTHSTLDLVLQPFCRWQGRGIGILISLATVEADQVALVGLLAHELSHCLAEDFIGQNRATPASSAETVGQLAACKRLFGKSERDATDETYSIEASDTHHSQRWQRAALHLRHRLAERANYVLGVHELLSPTAAIYDLHRELLRTNEYRNFEAISFEEILRQPLPAGI